MMEDLLADLIEASDAQDMRVSHVRDLCTAIGNGHYSLAALYWPQAAPDLKLLQGLREWIADREFALEQRLQAALFEVQREQVSEAKPMSRGAFLAAQRAQQDALVPVALLEQREPDQLACNRLASLADLARKLYSDQPEREDSPDA